jgi:two-component system sensor histidine kinase KdpD
MGDSRRNPDEILNAIRREEAVANQGRLRVFLGMCPGVGKTYAMLKAAREQASRDTQVGAVLVGVVETHGRKDTQELLTGLEILPRKNLDYKGSALTEMDLDRILELKPKLVLVDELAHTNAPGSRHAKRYQDVQEILAAGINVYTTVNIQHIESRTDQVAQITGVQVQETVPDSVLASADQIEVIDLSPGELLKRLGEGKVYIGDRAARAAEGFFKEEHLLGLRELALRFTAEKVDQDLQDQMTIKGIEGPWNLNERLLVAVSHSPSSARLIRATRRMAYNLEAPWIALYVNNGEPLLVSDDEMLQKNINLARDLGAEVITIADRDISNAIAKISQDKNVTQIVMGRPDRRFLKDFFSGGTLLDRLVRETSKVDVHVIRAQRKPRYRNLQWAKPEFRTDFIPYYYTAWFMAAISCFCYALLPLVGYRALGSVFLLAILSVASFRRRGPALFAALCSAVIWNYFFIPPTFTFFISSSEDIMMVISFLVTAVVAGFLISRIRKQEEALANRESETRRLYEFGKHLSAAKDERQVALLLNQVIENQFKARSRVYLGDRDRKLRNLLSPQEKGTPHANEKDEAVAQWSFENNKAAGWSTQTLSASSCLCLTLKGNTGTVGVLAFYPPPGLKALTVEKENFLETVLAQTAIALERIHFGEAVQTAKLYEVSEKLHQTLLNSVSHELRTPITALIGSASALKDDKTFLDTKAREALTDEIIQSARRLDRVVENLLDVSRIEKDTLQLKKEWFEAGELVSALKTELKDELKDRILNYKSSHVVLIEADFKLLDHALAQLVLNAVKYSKPGSEIEIEVKSDQSEIQIIVRDHGKGFPPGSVDKIFDRFYRVPGTPAGGLGLGLAIVRSIIELHGGRVTAQNRGDGLGAEMTLILPYQAAPQILADSLKGGA